MIVEIKLLNQGQADRTRIQIFLIFSPLFQSAVCLLSLGFTMTYISLLRNAKPAINIFSLYVAMIIYPSYSSIELTISQENKVILIFWFSPLRVIRILITGTALNRTFRAWGLQILYMTFLLKPQMKEKLVVLFDLNYCKAARDSALRRKGFRVSLRTSYILALLLNTVVFICSLTEALHWGSVNMRSFREKWVCMSIRFYYGSVCLLE